jgi:hypothetical protein
MSVPRGETMLNRFVSVLLLFFVAGAAGAQFSEYTTPGGPDGRPADRKGQLAKETESARYHLGPLRIAPTISLQNVAYVKNLLGTGVAETPNDFTATVSGGFRAYLPASSRATFTAYVLPEYVWWQKETDRRRLDGLYGVGFDGFWNRLTLRLQVESDATQEVLSAEVPRLTNARTDQIGGTVELRLTGAVSAFVTGKVDTLQSLTDAEDPVSLLLAQLDHDERVARAGFHWRPTDDWLIGVGAEYSEVTFTDHQPGAVNRSNSGTAPVLEVSRENGRLYFHADVAQRSLTANQGATFAKYDKTTGNITVSYAFTPELELFVYANRNLEYSLESNYSYFDDLRHGASLHVKLGQRTAASIFGETGSLGYTGLTPGTPDRRDDLVAYGGAVTLNVAHGVAVSLVGSSTRFTSNLPGLGRSLNAVGLSVTLVAGQANSVVGPSS